MIQDKPLAFQMRPANFEEFVGQKHLTKSDTFFRKMIESNKLRSAIFYGPPGTGKTTLADIIANELDTKFIKLNATNATKKDMQNITKDLDTNTTLFIDEIHRFNKAQQDYLLPFVESGQLTLIGATTENPYFEVNKALLSRATIFKFEPLTEANIEEVILRTLNFVNPNLTIEPSALFALNKLANNDARKAINLIEATLVIKEASSNQITLKDIEDMHQQPIINYDKDGDAHYDTISAFIKSMRGSDPDATLYYLAKMINAGEDIKFIARRIIISASEDVGLANPEALNLAVSASLAIERIGMPEARIVLAQAAVYNALSPKSNSTYLGINKALEIAKKDYAIPNHLKDTHYKGAATLGNGNDYKYSHDYPNNYVAQQYLPNELIDHKFYNTCSNGQELTMDKWSTFIKSKGI